MVNRVSGWLTVAACLVGYPALARPVSESEEAGEAERTAGSEIVVTGRQAMSPDEFDRAVEDFVKDLGRPGPINRISRWGEPLCPAAEGLSEPFNAFVTRRIKDIAARVGAPGPGECGDRANVLVLFTTRPHVLMSDVRKNHEGLLGYHFVGQRKSVAAFSPPMKSWYVTKTVIPGAYAAIDYAYGPSPPAGTGSLIRPQYKSRFAFVLIVVDSTELENQAIGPVADKIAMLALSNPGPREGCSPLPSILDFLESGCASAAASDGLTAYDESYLTALYAFDRDELKGFMRHEIEERIVAELGPLTERPAER